MKTFHSNETQQLRDQVRALQAQVGDLETRLALYETAEDDEMRALWPYSWVLSGVERVKHSLEAKYSKQRAPRLCLDDDEARFARMMM